MAEDPTTWSGLKTSARSWLAEISTDSLSDERLEECIAFAERSFNRVLRMAEMEDVVEATSDDATIALPDDFLQMRSIYIDSTTAIHLKEAGMAELREMFPSTASGTPSHYSLQSGSEMVVRPIPSGSFTYVLNYYKTIPALDAVNTTNWLLTAHPDIYLVGTLYYAHIFLLDEKRAFIFKSQLDLFIDEMTKQNNRKAWSGAPISPTRSTTNIRNINA